MHWLALSILADYGFVQLFKYSQRRGYRAPVVVTTNYLVVAGVLAGYLALVGRLTISPAALQTGLVTGAAFITSMGLMTRVLETVPVGAVLTAFRMAVAIPVVLGIWIWGEPAAPGQLGGFLLALVALGLMTSGAGRTARLRGARTFGVLFAVFLMQGLSHSCLRSVHYNGLDEEFVQVIMVTGGTAATLGFLFLLCTRRRPVRSEIAMGGGIGLYNALALCVVMTALSRLPGTLFFPVMGCSVVLLDNLTAHYFWKERLTRAAGAGVAFAILAISLVIQ